jgi:branched-chain amino acid aminotransferase
VWLNGTLVPRSRATVSVLDAGFLLGDGVWEAMRLHNGKVAFLDAHLDRLFEGLAAIDIDPGMTRTGFALAIDETVAANGMRDGVHMRLMVTRGLKSTPFQGTSARASGPTVVLLAEYKEADPHLATRGLKLMTVHVRRGRPDVQDPGWNSHSKLNCITACIQAEKMGADEGLMLDPHGFVATCNSTHFFIIRDGGEVWTSSGRYCIEGITRAKVLETASRAGMVTRQTDFALRKVYSAEEAFCTGTFGGIMPVVSVDGRTIGTGARGPVTARLQELYAELIEADTR